MQRRLLLDVVVGQRATVLQLLPGEDQSLLVGRDALLVLDLGLDVLDRVRRLDLQRDRLARQGLDEDLHFPVARLSGRACDRANKRVRVSGLRLRRPEFAAGGRLRGTPHVCSCGQGARATRWQRKRAQERGFRFLTKISRPIPSESFALNPHGFNRELFFRSRQGAGLP